MERTHTSFQYLGHTYLYIMLQVGKLVYSRFQAPLSTRVCQMLRKDKKAFLQPMKFLFSPHETGRSRFNRVMLLILSIAFLLWGKGTQPRLSQHWVYPVPPKQPETALLQLGSESRSALVTPRCPFSSFSYCLASFRCQSLGSHRQNNLERPHEEALLHSRGCSSVLRVLQILGFITLL